MSFKVQLAVHSMGHCTLCCARFSTNDWVARGEGEGGIYLDFSALGVYEGGGEWGMVHQ